MKNIGYINFAHDYEQIPVLYDSIKRFCCSKLYKENSDDTARPMWHSFIDDLEEGDTAAFVSFNNAFKNICEMTMFLKLCTSKNIRIVSLYDSIDSRDMFFSSSNTQNAFDVISKMPFVNSAPIAEAPTSDMVALNNNSKVLKKNMYVINMYKAGFAIQVIMRKTGIKSKSTIYNILHKYNISLDYPTKVRAKNGMKDNPQQI